MDTIRHWKLGVHLTSVTGASIDDLAQEACKDRLSFAYLSLKSAKTAAKLPKAQHRLTLARAYYAMYHAARAVVYFTKGGDDHEAHSEVVKHLPNDFPDKAKWENSLKNARLERNRADYDPYPKGERLFAVPASGVLADASAFLPQVRRFLVRKGCRL